MNTYKENESFKHKCAKELLAKWLTDIDRSNIDFCSLEPFYWRSNYGVFTELPFHITDDIYYFECSKGIKTGENGEILHYNRNGKPEDYFNPAFNRGEILFIPDICIFHKGTPTIFIEIVNTSFCSNKKINKIKKFFDSCYIEVWEVFADDILNLTSIPEKIKAHRIL
jgi:hypothetical protein